LAYGVAASRLDACERQAGRDPQAVLRRWTGTDEGPRSSIERIEEHYCLAYVNLNLVYPERAKESLDKLDEIVREKNDAWLLAKAAVLRAGALDALGKPMQGLAMVSGAVSTAAELGDPALEVDALKVSGQIRISLIDYLGALKDLNRAYSLASGLGEEARVSVGSYIALVYEYREEYDLALPYFKMAADFYSQHDSDTDASIALYGLGNANAKLGNLDLGRGQLEQSLIHARKVDDAQGVAYALKELANIDTRQRRYDDALARLLEARRLAATSQNPYLKIDLASYLIDVYLATGRITAAEQLFEEAAQLIDAEAMPIHRLRLEERRAALDAARGRYEGAYRKLLGISDERVALINKQSSKQLLQLRSQYELDAKEQENRLLQRVNAATAAELGAQKSRNVFLRLLLAAAMLIFTLLIYIVFKSRQVRRKLEVLANEDALTGLNNRRRTFELIERQLQLASRHKFPLAIAVFDLDHFKRVNDQHGHHTGDLVLKAFAQLLKSGFRSTDVTGRIGGEEFVLAMSHAHAHEALVALDRLRAKVHEIPAMVGNDQLRTSFSCGLCMAREGMSVTALLAEADRLLYRAKAEGRDRVVVDGAPEGPADQATFSSPRSPSASLPETLAGVASVVASRVD